MEGTGMEDLTILATNPMDPTVSWLCLPRMTRMEKKDGWYQDTWDDGW